jgi:NAD(P)-dependent dehydrogenase (short-subunit alcohol dehydrogenase family)
VVVAGRREAEGAESVALIEKAGGKGLFVRTDVTIESEIASSVARTLEHFGRLDFAFNNAGIGGEAGAGIANTGEVFDRIMNINVRGVFFGMKYQIPVTLQSGGGAIVNNASVLAMKHVAHALKSPPPQSHPRSNRQIRVVDFSFTRSFHQRLAFEIPEASFIRIIRAYQHLFCTISAIRVSCRLCTAINQTISKG